MSALLVTIAWVGLGLGLTLLAFELAAWARALVCWLRRQSTRRYPSAEDQ